MARLPYDPGLVLVVSERTSYILHNLAIADIADSSRYAIYPPVDGWYQPVKPSDGPEYGVFEKIARDFERDIVEVGTVPIYGYLSAHNAQVSLVAPSDGYFVLEIDSVPEGEMWEVQALEAVVSGSNPGLIQFTIDQASIITTIDVALSPGNGVYLLWDGKLVVGPGGTIQFRFSALNGNTMVGRAMYAKLMA